jgi:hypothetical protein
MVQPLVHRLFLKENDNVLNSLESIFRQVIFVHWKEDGQTINELCLERLKRCFEPETVNRLATVRSGPKISGPD